MRTLPKLAAAVGVAAAALFVAPDAMADHCTGGTCRHCQSCEDTYDGGVICWFWMNGGGDMTSCWEEAEWDPETGEMTREWCEGYYGCFGAE